jgi:hypothetical protein
VTRFRLNAAAAVAAAIAIIGAIPLAATSWYLAPIVVIPIAVAVWAWRCGTDADAHGLVVRALVGTRRVPWTAIEALAPDDRGRVYARLTGGSALRLTGVTAADLLRLLAVTGAQMSATQTSATQTSATQTPATQTPATLTSGAAPRQ